MFHCLWDLMTLGETIQGLKVKFKKLFWVCLPFGGQAWEQGSIWSLPISLSGCEKRGTTPLNKKSPDVMGTPSSGKGAVEETGARGRSYEGTGTWGSLLQQAEWRCPPRTQSPFFLDGIPGGWFMSTQPSELHQVFLWDCCSRRAHFSYGLLGRRYQNVLRKLPSFVDLHCQKGTCQMSWKSHNWTRIRAAVAREAMQEKHDVLRAEGLCGLPGRGQAVVGRWQQTDVPVLRQGTTCIATSPATSQHPPPRKLIICRRVGTRKRRWTWWPGGFS